MFTNAFLFHLRPQFIKYSGAEVIPIWHDVAFSNSIVHPIEDPESFYQELRRQPEAFECHCGESRNTSSYKRQRLTIATQVLPRPLSLNYAKFDLRQGGVLLRRALVYSTSDDPLIQPADASTFDRVRAGR